MCLSFDTAYSDILKRMAGIDPLRYAATRNYADGAVTKLSPYISRGVISTRQVLEKTLSMGLSHSAIEKFVQELAWRDYWQQVWISKGNAINFDLKHPQIDVNNNSMPTAIHEGNCGIDAVDKAIQELYRNGYMHNHIRMYTASLACNIAGSHWLTPARWMYYHLLDGDWASNALSWQWVAGTNANKRYIANQDNINKYCRTRQKDTYLDVSYEALIHLSIPHELKESSTPEMITQLPDHTSLKLDKSLPTLVYNYYNLDPQWRHTESANRILLLEPTIFAQYPVAVKNIHFTIKLAQNIDGIQIFTGEYKALELLLDNGKIFFKEHPLNRHYRGHSDERDWMFNVTGYYPSFFAFWKHCKKEMKTW